MFKLQVSVSVQQEDVTHATVGSVVFIITYIHSLIFHWIYDSLKVKNCPLN